MSLYALKPRFQAMLRPGVITLARRGITANQVTAVACIGSVLLGIALWLTGGWRPLFVLVPLWLLARMALNAVDGMLAREHDQKSRLGGYLNELSDVVSDAAVILPFALVAPFDLLWIGIVIFLAALSEYAGVMGPLVGASRRYDGPLGKSDRALVFGALGLWIGLGLPLPAWLFWLLPLVAALLVLTTINRVQKGLTEP